MEIQAQAINKGILQSYEIGNAIGFFILLAVFILVLRSVINSGKDGRKDLRPTKHRFIELEKDYVWRRLKFLYVILTVLLPLIVIGATYGSASKPPFQSQEDFDIKRAGDAISTIIATTFTLLILWVFYRFILPRLYGQLLKAQAYLKKS